MGQPVAVTKALTAASDNAICLSQSPGAAGNLTINGASASGGVATLDSQRRVIITSAADDSAKTFIVTGTNDYGAPIKDSFAGANTGIAQSNLNFKTVTQVHISAASAGAVKVGTNGVGSSPWVLFDSHIPTPNISFAAVLNSGSATIQVEYTYDEVVNSPVGSGSAIAYAPATPVPLAWLHPSLQNLSESNDGGLTFPFRAWRFTILSGTGSWTVTGTQGGISGP